jgi:hypothetical protein
MAGIYKFLLLTSNYMRNDNEAVEFADEVAESLSDQEDLEGVERLDTSGVEKVDVEYEGDTYRIRTFYKSEGTRSTATIKRVDDYEEVKVGKAIGTNAEEVVDEVYAEVTGDGFQPSETLLDSYLGKDSGQSDDESRFNTDYLTGRWQ